VTLACFWPSLPTDHRLDPAARALSPGAEHVPHLWLDTGGGTESIALSPGERVSRSGASTSRSGTGEGSLAQFREPTSSLAPRSCTAVQGLVAQTCFLGLRLFRNPVLQRRLVANLCLQRPAAPRGRCGVLSFGWAAAQGAGRAGRGGL
jgi:hypothetical protein